MKIKNKQKTKKKQNSIQKPVRLLAIFYKKEKKELDPLF